MSFSGLSPVQAALYALLAADSGTLGTLVDGIFDDVPEGELQKYIVIGEGTETPFRTFGRNGHEDTVTVHVWSRDDGGNSSTGSSGTKRVQSIIERMSNLIETGPFTVTGHSTAMAQVEFTEIMRSEDENGVLWRHGIVRYRVIVEDSP